MKQNCMKKNVNCYIFFMNIAVYIICVNEFFITFQKKVKVKNVIMCEKAYFTKHLKNKNYKVVHKDVS